MKKIILLFFITSLLFAGKIENNEIDNLQNGIDNVLLEKFDEAYKIFKEIKNKYPNYPLGYFAIGSYYNAMTVNYETDIYLDSTKYYYEKAIEIADSLLDDNEDDPWLLFYIGASKSNIGFTYGREGRYTRAINTTFSAIGYLEDCVEIDPNFNDAKFIIGAYRYYRSNVTAWIYDSRDEGIELIYETINNSLFSKYFAVSTLSWIYIDYEKYDKAIKVADIGLKKYPNRRYFLWSKARAYYESGEYYEAIKLYRNILGQLLVDRKSNFDLFNNYYLLTKCYLGLKDYNSSKYYVSKALKLKLSPYNEDRLDDKIDELKDLFDDLQDGDY